MTDKTIGAWHSVLRQIVRTAIKHNKNNQSPIKKY